MPRINPPKPEPKRAKCPTLYIGNYFDGEDENYLIFVSDANCDREKELKRAFKVEYNRQLDNSDIRAIFLANEAMDYKTRDSYVISLELIP